MEIVKVSLGRAVWLFDTQNLNPRGTSLYPDIYAEFAKRYQFANPPSAEEIHNGASLYFKQGRFQYEASAVAIDFELHSDGLVANSRHSTEAASAFLQDAVLWCQEQLGVVYPVNIVKKRVYRSELIVTMNPKLDALNEQIQQFALLVSEITMKPSRLMGLQFGAQDIPAAFMVERRTADTPLEDNSYITNAWMQTSQHLDLLQHFEKIFSVSA